MVRYTWAVMVTDWPMMVRPSNRRNPRINRHSRALCSLRGIAPGPDKGSGERSRTSTGGPSHLNFGGFGVTYARPRKRKKNARQYPSDVPGGIVGADTAHEQKADAAERQPEEVPANQCERINTGDYEAA